jgi:Chitobiase/beta-hexosaminidase C-terminal domain/Viral BACON domain
MIAMTASQNLVSHEATSDNARLATGFIPSSSASIRLHHQWPVLSRITCPWSILLAFFLLTLACRSALAASPEFTTVPAVNFSTTVGLDNPLSQVISVGSTGSPIAFTAAASANSGGAWLTINPSNYGYGVDTPYAITVIAAPAVTTAAGTYTGQITLTPITSGVNPVVIPVTLVVHSATDTYFDQIAGGLTFSLATEGNAPPSQAIQVRNAGQGSLAWTASTSTADGGSWLNLSASSGTAPSNLTAGITLANLPGTGLTAGTFVGEITFNYTVSSVVTDSITVPVVVNVGTSVYAQVNPLSFVKTFAGANPLSQVITIANTGSTAIAFTASVQNSTGGSWLTINPSNYGYGVDTPYNITVGVNPAITLAAGRYMAEVIVTENGGNQTLSIPVTLTVNSPSATYFDNVAGALNFSMATGGDAPPTQPIQIRNAGAGTLSWTGSVNTADGGSWLSLTSASGSAPDDISVAVNPENLPGGGLTAGTFVGQVLLASSTSRVTVPVSFTVGAAAFRQVNPLGFTKVFGGLNPLPQEITIASTGAAIAFGASVINASGGSWLTINPSNYGYGVNTPYAITVGVNPAVTLAAGTYSAEVLVQAISGAQALTIPVTLTIQEPTATFFDDLPGQMAFFMATGGNAPPAQVLPIRNAGQSTLDWTATVTTSDGGNWLSISAEDGTAPSEPTVSVNPANIPGGGLVAGTFTGQVVLAENGQQISVPVMFTVGANVFRQNNPLTFTMTAGGANPLPQVVTVAGAGTAVAFTASAQQSTGGSWLTINPSNYGYGVNTPYTITVGVNAAATLGAGTYSSEVIVTSTDGTQGMTIPVTLIVEPKTAAFFDSLPGQITFSMATMGTAPPSQPLQIRNAGAGTLAWTATVTTSDGGSWLSISSSSGNAPFVPQITVNPANIPGEGLIAGTFTGQVILSTDGDSVTIPIAFTVDANVFRQVNGLNFNMVQGGTSPLPQIVNITSTGASFAVGGTIATSTGGSWLTINPSNYGYGIGTTFQLIVTLTPAVTLPAGTYTSEIILTSTAGSPDMVIPVTLTVNAPTATFFDDVPGGVTFFQATGGANPASQSFAIRNAGTGPGSLSWKAAASTSDGGNWLHISSTSGTAPDTLTVSVTSANLPGEGLTAGSFNGQIVLTSGNDIETVPVAFVVGANVFEPIKPLTFTKPYGGSNPGAQPLIAESTATNFSIFGLAASAIGGNWLSINPSNFGYGIGTPTVVEASAAPVANLAPGSYLGEVILYSTAGDQGMVVPVTLNVVSVPAATPAISRRSGFYIGLQTVTISDATHGATIYYSTNGKAPTGASTRYTGTITIPVSEKVEAIAYAPGFLPSAVSSASYTIIANTPKIAPAGGTFVSDTTVSITDAYHGSEIFYTTNGTKPTKSSTRYTKSFVVSKNETVMAVAFATGVNESAVATAKIAVKSATPKFSVKAGKYPKAFSVAITDATKGARIYYTTNGKTPTTASTRYTKAITVSKNETIKAVALVPGGSYSTVESAAYTISDSKSAAVSADGTEER